MTEPENDCSAAQADHIELCNLLKEKIKDKLDGDLTTAEIFDLSRSAKEVLYLEIDARAFDQLLERAGWEQQ